jgi:hypothetical protein
MVRQIDYCDDHCDHDQKPNRPSRAACRPLSFRLSFPKLGIEPLIDPYLNRMLMDLDFRMNRACMSRVVAYLCLEHRELLVKAIGGDLPVHLSEIVQEMLLYRNVSRCQPVKPILHIVRDFVIQKSLWSTFHGFYP